MINLIEGIPLFVVETLNLKCDTNFNIETSSYCLEFDNTYEWEFKVRKKFFKKYKTIIDINDSKGKQELNCSMHDVFDIKSEVTNLLVVA